MIIFLILELISTIFLLILGMLTWSLFFHLKQPGHKPDFFREAGAYFSWLKSFFVWAKDSVTSIDWLTLIPPINMHDVVHYGFWVLFLPVLFLAIPLFRFGEKLITTNGFHEAISLELLELTRRKASEGEETRRKLALEEFDRFAQGMAVANSGSRALFINGQPISLSSLAEKIRGNVMDEREKRKRKTPDILWTAKIWYLLLNGRLKQARVAFKERASNVASPNLVALLEEKNNRFSFWLQAKLVRKLGGHPRNLKVTFTDGNRTRTYTGMQALYQIQLAAPKLSKNDITLAANLEE